MKLYTVSPSYLDESIRVSPRNKNILHKSRRPYYLCPITIKNVGTIECLIPLSSASFIKNAHQKSVNSKSETKLIHQKTGKFLGLIRYFDMLIKPQDPAAIQEIELDSLEKDEYYQKLSSSIEVIKNIKGEIARMAEAVYCDYRFMPLHIKKQTPLYSYCNNFIALEELAKTYKEPTYDEYTELGAVGGAVASTSTTLIGSEELLDAVGGASASASFAPTELEALVDEISDTLDSTALAPALAQDVQKVEDIPRRSRAAMRKHKAKAKKQLANTNKT